MNFKPNQIIDKRYRITAKLGDGSMGGVWKATGSQANDRVVAIKFPLKYRDPEALKCFARQATAMRGLAGDCDELLNILGVGSIAVKGVGKLPYYTMQLQTGGSMRKWKPAIEQDGSPVLTRESMAWVSDVAKALDFLHQQEVPVCHGNVKPENILFDATGAAKLADFGLIKNANAIANTAAAMAYMPPEILRGGEFTPASDQFSFAASIYGMLAGKRPYEGESPSALADAFSKGHESLQQSIGLAAGASKALDHALGHDPEKRFRSCTTFAKVFLLGLQSKEDLNKPAEKPQPASNRGFGKVALIGLGVLVLVGLISGGLFFSGALSPAPTELSSQQYKQSVLPVVQQHAELGFAGAEMELAFRASKSGDDVAAVEWYRKAADQGFAEAQFNLGKMYSAGLGVGRNKKEAENWYRKAADQGFADAQCSLGEMLDASRSCKFSQEAVEWYRKAAEQGLADAQFNLGKMYASGSGVSKNEKEAVHWFRKSAEQGLAEAQLGLGAMYDEGFGVGRNEKEAAKWYRKSAEQGFADAQFSFGMTLYNGRGGDQDHQEAAKWFRKAAEQGIAEAQHNLGVMYGEGLGVGRNEKEAAIWYRKSAEQGFADAQFSFGVTLYNGRGGDQDHQEAAKWFRKAAEQGIAEAQNNLGAMYGEGLGVGKDQKEAVKWYRKSAEQGFADAQFNLGVMYEEGVGVGKDEKEAVKWYRKAADQGLADAQFNLGLMYEEGVGVGKDEKEAVKWYRKAADQGLAEAQCNLGVMYDDGLGVGKDKKEAVNWYRKSAEQGVAQAQFNLAVMYENGLGVGKDKKEAVNWYRLAAKQGNKDAKNALRRLTK